MTDPNRPLSRWSTSLSITTKSTASTNQTIPLSNVRKKFFRQSAINQQNSAKRMEKVKYNIEELFKLYYSNDVKFDAFQRQIVTGTRIPTARRSLLTENNLNASSNNVFNSKHCVSREQLSTNDSNDHEPIIKSPTTKRSVQIRVENNSIITSPLPSVHSHPTTIPIQPNRPIISSTSIEQQDELCDATLVKSVTFLGDISNEDHENKNIKKNKLNNTQRLKSSILTIPSIPIQSSTLSAMNKTVRDPSNVSHTSFSTMNSTQSPTVVTGSAVTVRQRSGKKRSGSAQQRKSNTTVTATNVSPPQSPRKNCTPSITSPLAIEPDMPELPVFIGAPRVVSIPSKCSRYVLVTFPQAPLRYNAPSYIERLLLPKRFPNLFKNIVQSYDHHIITGRQQRNMK